MELSVPCAATEVSAEAEVVVDVVSIQTNRVNIFYNSVYLFSSLDSASDHRFRFESRRDAAMYFPPLTNSLRPSIYDLS